MSHFMFTVCVTLRRPLDDDSEPPGHLVGYYRNFGVTAQTEQEARLLVETRVGKDRGRGSKERHG